MTIDHFELIIHIINEYGQKDGIHIERLEDAAKTVLQKELKSGVFVLSVILVSDERIARLNQQYRDIDAPTDVLTFDTGLHNSDGPFDSHQPIELGDIFLSMDTIKRQASDYNNAFEEELLYILIHGLLHICGYDHKQDDTHGEEMFEVQKDYFQNLNH